MQGLDLLWIIKKGSSQVGSNPPVSFAWSFPGVLYNTGRSELGLAICQINIFLSTWGASLSM